MDNRLSPKKILNDTVVIGAGTAAGQLILVLTMPVITRLYDSSAFGALAVFTSCLMIINAVSTLRYELAIPLPRSEFKALTVVITCFGILVLVALLIFFNKNNLSNFVANLDLHLPRERFIHLLIFGVVAAGFYKVLMYWAIRESDFRLIAASKIWQAIATVVAQLASGALGGLGLIIALVCGHAAAGATLFWGLRANWAAIERKSLTFKTVVYRYRRFPMFSTFDSLINVLSLELAVVLLALNFSLYEVGLYSLAFRVLTIPITLVGKAVSQVFMSHLASGKLRKSEGFELLAAALLIVGAPPMLLIALSGSDAFEWVFGADWRDAGSLVAWMVPWLFLQFISVPMAGLFPVLEKQDHGLGWQLLLLLLRCAALFAGLAMGDFFITVTAYSFASALAYGVLFVWLAKLAQAKLSIISPYMMRSFLIAIGSSLPYLVFSTFTQPTAVLWRIIGFCISSIIVLMVTYRSIRRIKESNLGSDQIV